MSDNAQKTPLARTLNRFTEKKVLDAIQLTGKALPCRVSAVSGSIVTVNFEILSDFTLPEVTCPMFGPEYIRYPTQVNDLGVVISSDVYLGGVSGLGSQGSVANLSQRANLSKLIFLPIANKNWTPTENPNATVIYGPDGVIIRTVDLTSVVTVSPGVVISDTPSTSTTGNLLAGTGCSGSFTTPTGLVVTVQDGIIVNIY